MDIDTSASPDLLTVKKKEMQRELKFRAWNGEQMISPDYIGRDGLAYWKENSIPSATNKIMQFTNKKDKNGNDVYEGDILSVRPKGANYPIKYVVVFNEDAAFKLRFIDRYLRNEDSFYDIKIEPERNDIFEIIGNVYKTPELLN